MKKNKNTIILLVILIILLVLSIAAYVVYLIKINKNQELNSPEDIFGAYSNAIIGNNYGEVYNLMSNESKAKISQEDVEKRYEDIYSNLSVQNIEISNQRLDRIDNNNARITYSTKLTSNYGDINFENTLKLIKQDDNRYYISWDNSAIYPNLQESDKVEIDKDYAKRGSIVDRNGRLLAGAGYVESVGLVPGWMNEQTKTQDIAKVAEILGISVDSINKKLSASYVKTDTFVELETISKTEQTKIVKLKEIEGVKIKDIPSRVYPFAEKAAHLTGYVQKANKEDIKKNGTYDENTLIGRTGLEAIYNEKLAGKDGYEINIVDEKGNVKTNVLKTEKQDGENVKLTIDTDVQEKVYALYAQDNSATVVTNPKTGEILAMVSTPSYDPNKFVIGMSNAEWQELSNNKNNPLYARFLRSYAPGSSFKPIIGAIALQTGTITGADVYEPSGTSWQKDESWGSYNITTLKKYSQPANLLNALINSDNIFFAKTALKIGATKLEEQLKNIGFESNLKFDMNIAKSQISNEGKFTGEMQLADSGYGQGQILVNPVHMSAMYSAFVNDGNMVMPYLIYKENASNVEYLKQNAFTKAVADEIKNNLIQTIESPEGTAHSAKIAGVTLAGKTGTAETKSTKEEEAMELGWFNAFVADSNSTNQLMVISMVENVENKGGSLYVVQKVKNLFQ